MIKSGKNIFLNKKFKLHIQENRDQDEIDNSN